MGKQKLWVTRTCWIYWMEGKVIGWSEKQKGEWNHQNGWGQTLVAEATMLGLPWILTWFLIPKLCVHSSLCRSVAGCQYISPCETFVCGDASYSYDLNPQTVYSLAIVSPPCDALPYLWMCTYHSNWNSFLLFHILLTSSPGYHLTHLLRQLRLLWAASYNPTRLDSLPNKL